MPMTRTQRTHARNHAVEQLVKLEGDSTRSEKLERYDLIPVEAMKALAARYGLGAKKHGESNWKRGEKEFIKSCFNHLLHHYEHLVANGPLSDDDDIGALLWNAAALAWFRAHKIEEFHNAWEEMR